jgi:hypothetical protein
MSASILLLYAAETGHVLKAATVAAPPSDKLTAEALAGHVLPLRYFGDPAAANFATLRTSMPADTLAVHLVESDAAPISQIHITTVDPKDQTIGSINLTNKITSVSLQGNRDKLRVTITTPLAKEVSGLLRVERIASSGPADPADVQLKSFKIGGSAAVAVDVTILTLPVVPAGSYSVLMLVQGLPHYLSTV